MIVARDHRGGWTLRVTDEEFHDIHHALRMLLKSWLSPKGEEAERLTRSADILWNAHCDRVAVITGTRDDT